MTRLRTRTDAFETPEPYVLPLDSLGIGHFKLFITVTDSGNNVAHATVLVSRDGRRDRQFFCFLNRFDHNPDRPNEQLAGLSIFIRPDGNMPFAQISPNEAGRGEDLAVRWSGGRSLSATYLQVG